MKSTTTVLATAAALATSVFAVVVLTAGSKTPDAAAQLEHGRYLVTKVGLCIDCHTPHNERGELVESQQLQGATLPFAPLVPMPFAPAAPRIAGLPAGYTAETFTHFLMTGERPNGLPPPLPPMPPYRFSRTDAEAVTAFVQSLPTGLP